MKQTSQILEKLIAFDTTSAHSNLACIDYIKQHCQSFASNIHIDYNHDETKANILITLGPSTKDGIILSGHTDVVPVKNQQWDSDPFSLRTKDSKLFGRGTADMKGFIACALAVASSIDTDKLRRPIHLVFSYDEEVGCQGIPSMIDHIASSLPKPAFALIGEPTSMEIVTAHKGIACFETIVTGVEAHSSCSHQGVSAIVVASELIIQLKKILTEHEKNYDDQFTPPFSTFNIGTIEGGTAINIIPNHCRFIWEVRSIPSADTKNMVIIFLEHATSIEKNLKKTFPNCSITTKQWCQAPSLKNHNNHLPLETISAYLDSPTQKATSFATEAGLFQDAGFPAVVCGPGNIEQAHKPNEYVTVSQLEQCYHFLQKLTSSLMI